MKSYHIWASFATSLVMTVSTAPVEFEPASWTITVFSKAYRNDPAVKGEVKRCVVPLSKDSEQAGNIVDRGDIIVKRDDGAADIVLKNAYLTLLVHEQETEE